MITADYDSIADVLYIALGKPREASTIPTESGLLFRTDPVSREALGVTVTHYAELWTPRLDSLINEVAGLLNVPVHDIEKVILGVEVPAEDFEDPELDWLIAKNEREQGSSSAR